MNLLEDSLLTAEDLLDFPDDGKDRWAIRGELREKERTRRNQFHSRLEARVAQLIGDWIDQQTEPRGEVFSGEAGVILARNPDVSFGIAVIYFSAQAFGRQTGRSTMLEGLPTLAVEVLSPNDTQQEINEKIDEMLRLGVPLVWVIEPHFQTITVYQPNAVPRLLSIDDTISADPHLPGFNISVLRFFRRP